MKLNQKMKQMWGRIRERIREAMPRTMEDIRANEMSPELYLKRRSDRRKDIALEWVGGIGLVLVLWATFTLINVCF